MEVEHQKFLRKMAILHNWAPPKDDTVFSVVTRIWSNNNKQTISTDARTEDPYG